MHITNGRQPSRGWQGALAAGLLLLTSSLSPAFAAGSGQPVTYIGWVVTDVSLAGHLYHNADLTLKFQGNTADIGTFTIPNADVALISTGHASATLRSEGKTIDIEFPAGEIFISADTYNGGLGFGSNGPAGQQPGYPLAFTEGTARPYALYFDTATGSDPTVLQTTISLSGTAFSCVGYPDSAPACNDPTTAPLLTSTGETLIVYQPYVDFNEGAEHGTMNRGTFRIILGHND